MALFGPWCPRPRRKRPLNSKVYDGARVDGENGAETAAVVHFDPGPLVLSSLQTEAGRDVSVWTPYRLGELAPAQSHAMSSELELGRRSRSIADTDGAADETRQFLSCGLHLLRDAGPGDGAVALLCDGAGEKRLLVVLCVVVVDVGYGRPQLLVGRWRGGLHAARHTRKNTRRHALQVMKHALYSLLAKGVLDVEVAERENGDEDVGETEHRDNTKADVEHNRNIGVWVCVEEDERCDITRYDDGDERSDSLKHIAKVVGELGEQDVAGDGITPDEDDEDDTEVVEVREAGGENACEEGEVR
mmetsp:Transcript_32874/g.71014  ORF Transcript_32874/g.71014 Transcript_32874/m.71014 type:complete len:303 (+) Transcript_32874:275-1183(+)